MSSLAGEWRVLIRAESLPINIIARYADVYFFNSYHAEILRIIDFDRYFYKVSCSDFTMCKAAFRIEY